MRDPAARLPADDPRARPRSFAAPRLTEAGSAPAPAAALVSLRLYPPEINLTTARTGSRSSSRRPTPTASPAT